MDELETAIAAARAGGKILLNHFRQPHDIAHKAHFRDIVTEADKEADSVITDVLRHRTPAIAIQTEESGGAATNLYWCVDPLDGTMHYAFGLDSFSVSIGLIKDGRPVIGVVYCPIQNELFTAVQGKGAFRNGKPIHVSDRKELRDAMLATRGHEIRNATDTMDKVVSSVRAVRVAGSTAQDLAYLAAGWVDCLAKTGQSLWDYCAGWLLVQEAGGQFTGWDGRPLAITEKVDILASNKHLHGAMLALLR